MMTLIMNLAWGIASRLYYAAGYVRASMHGVRLTPGARISPRADVRWAASLGKTTVGANVTIGPGTYIASGSIDSGSIGAYCSIGSNVVIGPTEHSLGHWTTSPNLLRAVAEDHRLADRGKAPPRIGSDVWIGTGALILRGVTIGDGAVVGAAAVVTHDIPPYEVWGGVPARHLRHRFATERDREDAYARLRASLTALHPDASQWCVGHAAGTQDRPGSPEPSARGRSEATIAGQQP